MFQVTINGIFFTIEHQKSILQTVIDNGFSVSHSCRSGRCNECVARVQNNDTVNEILSCQYIPEPGDQFIFEKFEHIRLPKKQVYPAKIDKVTRLSDKYLLVKLKLPIGKKLDFLAGQYINVIKRGIGARSYSLASFEGSASILLIIQRVTGGQLSNFWFECAQEGDLLQIQGPFGSFYMRPNSSTTEAKTIFAATGSGIAPLISMLSSNPKLINDDFHGFWSMQYFENFFNHDLFDGTTDNNIWNRYLTKENRNGFGCGRIVKPIITLIEDLLMKDNKNIDVYACGNNSFLKSLKDQINEVSGANINFYADAFLESGADE